MRNPALKLASVVGIAGICILVILQVQRGLSVPPAANMAGAADPRPTTDEKGATVVPQQAAAAESPPPDQWEPEFDAVAPPRDRGTGASASPGEAIGLNEFDPEPLQPLPETEPDFPAASPSTGTNPFAPSPSIPDESTRTQPSGDPEFGPAPDVDAANLGTAPERRVRAAPTARELPDFPDSAAGPDLFGPREPAIEQPAEADAEFERQSAPMRELPPFGEQAEDDAAAHDLPRETGDAIPEKTTRGLPQVDSPSEMDQEKAAASTARQAADEFEVIPRRSEPPADRQPGLERPAEAQGAAEADAPEADAPGYVATPTSVRPSGDETGDGSATGPETAVTGLPETAPAIGPKLHIEQDVPPGAVVGQPFIYHLIVSNEGSDAALRVVVEDQVPDGVQLTGTIPRAVLAGRQLTWEIGDLAAGEEKRISIRVVPTVPGTIRSVATARMAVVAATPLGAPASDAGTAVLKLRVSAPAQARPGESIVLRFTVANMGLVDAQNVKIRNIMGAGLKHPQGGDIEYLLGRLPAGQSRSVDLRLTVASAGRHDNRTVVTASGMEFIEHTSHIEAFAPQLRVERVGEGETPIGVPAVFENRVSNLSPHPLADATLVEVLPAGFEFVEASDGGQFNPHTRTVAWRVERLAPHESKEFRVKVLPKALGQQQSVVRVLTAGVPRAEAVAASRVVGFSSLSAAIVPAGATPAPLSVGSRTAYQLIVRNRGSGAATGVRVTIAVPGELRLIGAPDLAGPIPGEGQHQFALTAPVGPGEQQIFPLEVEGVHGGDARLTVSIESNQMESPLTQQEAVLVVPAR